MNVLNVRIDNYTAKEALEKVDGFMKTEAVNTVEIVTSDVLMRIAGEEGLKEKIEEFDIVLPGDEAILEASDPASSRMEELRNRVFTYNFLTYLHENKTKVFILADTEKELQDVRTYFEENTDGIEITGTAVVPADDSADDMISNEVNGSEATCIISCIASSNQELFISRCKNALNVRLWIGIGKLEVLCAGKKTWFVKMKEFTEKKILKNRVVKEKNKNI